MTTELLRNFSYDASFEVGRNYAPGVVSSPVRRPADPGAGEHQRGERKMDGDKGREGTQAGRLWSFFQKLYCQQQYKNKKLYLQNYGHLILPSLVSLLT